LIGAQSVLDIGALEPHAAGLNPSRAATTDALSKWREASHREIEKMSETREGLAIRPTLSARGARRMVDAAIAQAESMSVPVTVVVVDESGVTKEMVRMDGAPLVSVQTAINKAYSAAAIGMPPDDFYAAIESDSAAVTEFGTRAGLALIAGGLPVIADGKAAGAIGVAGAMTAADDRRIAEVALAGAGG
jgi:glc operon protein GlcG